MRCQACDKNLNDWESTKKNQETGEFEDLCTKCLNVVIKSRNGSGGIDDDLRKATYVHEEDVTPDRPSNFDYYEGNWDGDYDDD